MSKSSKGMKKELLLLGEETIGYNDDAINSVVDNLFLLIQFDSTNRKFC